jgi:hypothetical protein
MMWPTIYTSLLTGLVIFGGTVLFIVPGIIFSVWYVFSTYAVILDNKKGGVALKFSKSLVIGRWWRMVWRIVVPSLLFGLIAYVIILAIILPTNWSYFSTSLNSAINIPEISSTSSYVDYQRLLAEAAPLPSIGLTIFNGLITAIVYMFLVPISTVAMSMLYLSAKENPETEVPPVSSLT